jgi:hypothetical protein
VRERQKTFQRDATFRPVLMIYKFSVISSFESTVNHFVQHYALLCSSY